MNPVLTAYEDAAAALRALPSDVGGLRSWDEATLLAASKIHSELGRLLGTSGAAIAGEMAYRSRPELGNSGLARRTGHRTVENLLKSTTGATKGQVVTAMRAGTLLTETFDDGKVDVLTGEVFSASRPWLRPVALAVAAGSISASASESIGNGLGKPNSAVTAEQLEKAAIQLVTQAVAGVDADRLYKNALDLRNELDLDGVKIREEEVHQSRTFGYKLLPNGGSRFWGTADIEQTAVIVDIHDRLTSPKLGGVRFIDPVKAAQADAIKDDPRSPGQMAIDGIIHLLAAGADIDDSVMLGTGAPVVSITVAQESLETGVGLARIEGQAAPVSLKTVERLLCEAEVITTTFDEHGHFIETNSDTRLYNRRQRRILASKFGGCMDPDCDRPPSWCEAHHIQHWVRDHGKTLIDNGILLCKFHHLKYHNDGYEIRIDEHGHYWKIPPTSVDPAQTPIRMPLKTRNLADLTAATERAHQRAAS